MRRPRGPGGRFLTADEVASLERKAEGGEDVFDEGGSESDGRSMKRKASEDGGGLGNGGGVGGGKKAKREGTSEDEDDADEDDEG